MRGFACLASALLLACGSSDGGGTGNPGTPDASMTSGDGSMKPPVDAPPVTPGTDPADDGTYTVSTMTANIPGAAQGRTLAATVFVPSGGQPHPLVVMSPGFQMARAQYTSYARHLATWGFVVVLTDYAESGFSIDHNRLANDVPKVIDWALAEVSVQIDATRIATAGHSLGGKISMYAASLDSRIKAVVGWDPVDSNSPSVAPEKMANMTAAVAVVGETTNGSGGFMPCAPAADNFQQFYAAAKTPALSITVVGADHMDWVDDPSCGVCGFCTAGSASPDLARKVTRRLDVAWLRRHLMADMAMDPWLMSPPEAGSGGVTIQHK